MERMEMYAKEALPLQGREGQQVQPAYLPAGPGDGPRVCFRLCGVERSTGQYVLQLREELAGRPVEVFAFVISADGKMVSDSQYLGRLG